MVARAWRAASVAGRRSRGDVGHAVDRRSTGQIQASSCRRPGRRARPRRCAGVSQQSQPSIIPRRRGGRPACPGRRACGVLLASDCPPTPAGRRRCPRRCHGRTCVTSNPAAVARAVTAANTSSRLHGTPSNAAAGATRRGHEIEAAIGRRSQDDAAPIGIVLQGIHRLGARWPGQIRCVRADQHHRVVAGGQRRRHGMRHPCGEVAVDLRGKGEAASVRREAGIGGDESPHRVLGAGRRHEQEHRPARLRHRVERVEQQRAAQRMGGVVIARRAVASCLALPDPGPASPPPDD